MRTIARTCFAVTTFLLTTTLTVQAADRVAVIPLWTTKDLQNVVTVAKKNGDYTDPIAALQSITDAGPNNPYLVVIGPGEYHLSAQLVMKEYVVITGSGVAATRLTGTVGSADFDATMALAVGADHAALRWLTLVNSGNGTRYTAGLYLDGASPDIGHVTVKVNGTLDNYGIIGMYSTATIHDSTIVAENGTDCTGIAAGSGGDLDLSNLTIMSTDASHSNSGLSFYYASPKIANVKITVVGGSFASYGTFGYFASPLLANVSSTAGGANQYNYGAYFYSSTPVIRRSTLEGETHNTSTPYGLYSRDGTAMVSQSTIIGGVGGVGTRTCVASDNGAGGVLSQNGCN